MAVKEIPEPGDLEHSRNKHREDTITWLPDHGAKSTAVGECWELPRDPCSGVSLSSTAAQGGGALNLILGPGSSTTKGTR